MDPVALGCIALAAVLHAAWNILLKTAGDRVGTAAAGMTVGSMALVPAAVVAWIVTGRPEVPPAAWGVGLVSGVVETAYFVWLSEAYRRADLSVVYPVARGTAPLLSVLVGVAVLGERLAPTGWFGVGLLVGGLLVVQRPWRFLVDGPGRADRGGIAFALLTGVAIAGYSSLDRVGVQLAPVWAYAAIIWPATSLGLLLVLRMRGRPTSGLTGSPARAAGVGAADAQAAMGPARVSLASRPAIVGGTLMLATYGLVLIALARAPLVIVAPLRESAVVLGSAWAVVRLGEAASRREVGLRLAGALLVLAGAVVLAVGR